tara:strand:- start:149 stop:379 length:231 start_codon:yes stop_codon:yes gene_type:complete
MNNKHTTDHKHQFKDKVAIITGSTQGSGAETAKLFASRGAKGITICGRNDNKGLVSRKRLSRLDQNVFISKQIWQM